MFGRKAKQEQAAPPQNSAETGATTPKRPKRRIFRLILKYFALLVLLLIVATAAAGYWLTQTVSGQTWLVSEVNAILAPAPGAKGMAFRITSLSGSLPLDFQFGIEASDAKGVWLAAPENRFTLNWRELPARLHISAVQALNVDVSRLPETGPEPEPPAPSKPVTLADVREMLGQAADFLAAPHWWLPDVVVDGVRIEPVLLPGGLLPQKVEARPALSASLAMSLIRGVLDLKADAGLKNAGNEAVDLGQMKFGDLKAGATLKVEPVNGALDASLGMRTSIADTALAVADIPAGFLGQNIDLALDVNATAGREAMRVHLNGPSLKAGHVTLAGSGQWQSGEGWRRDSVDGPLDIGLNLAIQPLEAQREEQSPLAMLRSPASLQMAVRGDLPVVDAEISLAASDIEKDGHSLRDLRLAISSQGLDLPLSDAAIKALENEQRVNLVLSGKVDNEPLDLSALCHFQQLPKKAASGGGWLAGLRDLRLDALGLAARGNMAARLPDGAEPALDGSLGLEIADWHAIAAFVPGQNFSGRIRADVGLASTSSGQQANVRLDIPAFAMLSASDGKGVSISRLTGDVHLDDIFKKLAIRANVEAASINAADMKFGVKVGAQGPIAGPLEARVATSGDIMANLAAKWQPGQVEVGTLDVRMNVPANGGKALLGVRSAGTAHVEYGDRGIGVRNLDLAITPSGRLRATGALAPDKLDFDLRLDNLAFKPWQALVAQIPEGSASAAITLKGTPQRPQGNLNLAVSKVKVPGVPLAPVGATLKGSIANRGASSNLALALDLDRETVKTLGGTVASVNASLPLLFGADGIPRPDMKGNLSAKVRWDGALGPIWNLLPMPDKRLNGRVAVNIDAAGSLATPRITGGININKARFEDLLLGVLLTDINLRLDLSDKGVRKKPAPQGAVDSLPGSMTLALNASDGRGGTVNVNGSGALAGTDLDITAKIDRLKPLRRRDVHIELSGNARVTGAAMAPVVDGEIIVNQGEVLLDNISFGGSVTTLPITTPQQLKKEQEEKEKAAAAPVAASKNQGSLNVRFNMLPRFTVEGRGLTSIWQAHLLIGGTAFNPQVTGNISVVKGNFDFLGKNFVMSRGLVTFAGGSLANPLLDIELTNETPDLTAHIIVSGPVSKIKLSMTSEPSLPRDEILSRVLFGRSINDLSRLEALQLAGAVAQLAGFGSGAGGILNVAKKTLGVDVLRLGSANAEQGGEPGETTAAGTTIEMGKYINDMIYMGVQQGMKADSTAFIIQLELTPRTSFEFRTEQDNTWGGIKWKYNY